MSDATRQEVKEQVGELLLYQNTVRWQRWEEALDAHEADERRRAVAALGCQYGRDGTTCRTRRWKNGARWHPKHWCAPCRAQAALEAEG